MKYFEYEKNRLLVEEVAVEDIATQVGTPFYCYSEAALIENYQNFARNLQGLNHKICYAIKANCNLSLVRVFAEMGAGVDAVSAGEIWRALRAGIKAEKIVFAGVGKSKEEMRFALQNGVMEFSVESEPELYLLSEVASSLGKIAKVALRVNPHVDAHSHHKISTGRKEDKFGIDILEAPRIYQQIHNKEPGLRGVRVFGIATHIGSQITSLEPFRLAFDKLRALYLELTKQGIEIENLDFGGGVGILYNDEPIIAIAEYAQLIKEAVKNLPVSVTIAPGRALVGTAGIMVGEIIYVKKTAHKNFIIIDAAMNDLMRPGLYDSYHKVIKVEKEENKSTKAANRFDIVGPVCETTDVLAKNRPLPNPKPGELLAFLCSGAYGSSMSNEYNCRPLIPEVLVSGKSFKIIRQRPSYEQMASLEELI